MVIRLSVRIVVSHEQKVAEPSPDNLPKLIISDNDGRRVNCIQNANNVNVENVKRWNF